MQRKREERLEGQMMFWGKVNGNENDYLVCYALATPTLEEGDFPLKHVRSDDTPSSLFSMLSYLLVFKVEDVTVRTKRGGRGNNSRVVSSDLCTSHVTKSSRSRDPEFALVFPYRTQCGIYNRVHDDFPKVSLVLRKVARSRRKDNPTSRQE